MGHKKYKIDSTSGTELVSIEELIERKNNSLIIITKLMDEVKRLNENLEELKRKLLDNAVRDIHENHQT